MTLVDTNVISEMLRREPNAGVVDFFALENAPALSVVSIEEMAYGVAWRPSDLGRARWSGRRACVHVDACGSRSTVATKAEKPLRVNERRAHS